MNAMSPITAAHCHDDRAICPDCGSAARGRSFFNKPYCGLCQRTIHEDVSLAPLTRTAQGWGA